MNSYQARLILQTLLDGRDPITRKPLPDGSPVLQNPVYLALEQAIRCLKKDMPNPPAKPPVRRFPTFSSQKPPTLKWWKKDRPHAGNPWSPEEIARLRILAATGMSEAEMGRLLGRGEKSVGVQLVKLGIRSR